CRCFSSVAGAQPHCRRFSFRAVTIAPVALRVAGVLARAAPRLPMPISTQHFLHPESAFSLQHQSPLGGTPLRVLHTLCQTPCSASSSAFWSHRQLAAGVLSKYCFAQE